MNSILFFDWGKSNSIPKDFSKYWIFRVSNLESNEIEYFKILPYLFIETTTNISYPSSKVFNFNDGNELVFFINKDEIYNESDKTSTLKKISFTVNMKFKNKRVLRNETNSIQIDYGTIYDTPIKFSGNKNFISSSFHNININPTGEETSHELIYKFYESDGGMGLNRKYYDGSLIDKLDYESEDDLSKNVPVLFIPRIK